MKLVESKFGVLLYIKHTLLEICLLHAKFPNFNYTNEKVTMIYENKSL